MAEDTQQQNQGELDPVTTTQDAPTPSAEQQTTPDVVETTQREQLPSEASDRTKSRFEVLTNELREERQRREALEQAFKTLQPKQEQTQQVVLSPIYDPETGFLNDAALAERDRLILEGRQQQEVLAQELNQERQRRAKEAQEREYQEAYNAHPEANPSSKTFDKEMKKRAAALILHSMVSPEEYGGKQFSMKDAYDYLKGGQSSMVDEAKKEGAQEALEQLTPKEQATLEATGTPARRSDISNLDDLKVRSRKGDFSAIVERMKRLQG